MKNYLIIFIGTIFIATTGISNAASPWEFEYWFADTGDNNTPETPFNLRVADTSGGPNFSNNQRNGNNNNNNNNNNPDVNFNTDLNAPNPNQQASNTKTSPSEWLIFAAIDTNPNKRKGATRALSGGMNIVESTLDGKGGLNKDGKATITVGDIFDSNDSRTLETENLAFLTKIEAGTKVDAGVPKKIKATGFDGATPKNGSTLSPTEVARPERLDDGSTQLYFLKGTLKDTKNSKFGKNNFFNPTNNAQKKLNYQFVAGYTTSGIDIARLAASEGNFGAQYNGSSLNGNYNVNMNIKLKDGTWTGTFTGLKKAPTFAVTNGTTTGAKFKGGVDVSKTVTSGNVVGALFGSNAQRGAGISTVKFKNNKDVHKDLRGKTIQDGFSISKGKGEGG